MVGVDWVVVTVEVEGDDAVDLSCSHIQRPDPDDGDHHRQRASEPHVWLLCVVPPAARRAKCGASPRSRAAGCRRVRRLPR